MVAYDCAGYKSLTITGLAPKCMAIKLPTANQATIKNSTFSPNKIYVDVIRNLLLSFSSSNEKRLLDREDEDSLGQSYLI